MNIAQLSNSTMKCQQRRGKGNGSFGQSCSLSNLHSGSQEIHDISWGDLFSDTSQGSDYSEFRAVYYC